MTLGETLRRTAQAVAPMSATEAALEAEVLLMHLLGVGRAQLYGRRKEALPPSLVEPLAGLVRRRQTGEPLAYLVGHREFYGLDFLVTPAVLIPRPETELLVEKALAWARSRPELVLSPAEGPVEGAVPFDKLKERPYPEPVEGRQRPLLVADVGTGCGNIAIALAKHLPQARLYAVDLSPVALEVAKENARRHQVADRITFLEGDLLAPLLEPVDLMVANLPSVRDDELSPLLAEVRPGVFAGEPELALRGGPDGLAVIQRFLSQAPPWLRPQGAIFLEVAYDQGEAAAALAESAFGGFPQAAVGLTRDWGGWNRVVSIHPATGSGGRAQRAAWPSW